MQMSSEPNKSYGLYNKLAREASDRYLTPISMILQLLDNEEFDYHDTFLECCSNHEKHIESTLRSQGYYNVYSNVFTETNTSFLDWNENVKFDYIVSNTPYKKATDFILKALKVARKKVCLLYPLSYVNGKDRFTRLWNNKTLGWSLTKLYVFVRRAMLETEFPEPTGMYYSAKSMMTYTWFIWEPTKSNKPSPPVLRWINNQQYILSGDNTIPTQSKPKTTPEIIENHQNDNQNTIKIRYYNANGEVYMPLKDICLFYGLDAKHSQRQFNGATVNKYSEHNVHASFKIPPNGNVISYSNYIEWRGKQSFSDEQCHAFNVALIHQQITHHRP